MESLTLPESPSQDELSNILMEFFRRNVEGRDENIGVPKPFLVQVDSQQFDVKVPVVNQFVDDKQKTPSQALGRPAPFISGFTPTTGSTNGGTVVTITGFNFVSGLTVLFGDVRGTNGSISVDGETITITSPAHAAGEVAIRVTNPDNQTSVRGGFVYSVVEIFPSAFTISWPPPIVNGFQIGVTYPTTVVANTNFNGSFILNDRPRYGIPECAVHRAGVLVCDGTTVPRWPTYYSSPGTPIQMTNGRATFNMVVTACAPVDYSTEFATGSMNLYVTDPLSAALPTLNGNTYQGIIFF